MTHCFAIVIRNFAEVFIITSTGRVTFFPNPNCPFLFPLFSLCLPSFPSLFLSLLLSLFPFLFFLFPSLFFLFPSLSLPFPPFFLFRVIFFPTTLRIPPPEGDANGNYIHPWGRLFKNRLA